MAATAHSLAVAAISLIFNALLLSVCPATLRAQSPFVQPLPEPATPGSPSGATNAAPKVKVEEISPGIFKLGEIKFSKEKRWVELPCKVEMREGVLEYVLVGPGGKKHESLLATDVDATLLHAVMLLMGVKNALNASDGIAKPPGQINAAYLATAPALHGAPIRLELRWTPPGGAPGQVNTAQAADWLMRTDLGAPPPPKEWIYTGSLFIQNVFMARLEQSFVSLVTDPNALINNPGSGRTDDKVWRPNTGNVPAVGTEVRLHITLDEPAPRMPASQPPPGGEK